jgi:hypothetical protein
MVELAVWFVENALGMADAAETNWAVIVVKKRNDCSVLGAISTVNVSAKPAVVSSGKDGELIFAQSTSVTTLIRNPWWWHKVCCHNV